MKGVYGHCRDAYNWLDDDAQDYFPGWVTPTEEEREALADEETPWIYQNSAKLKNAPYMGTLTTYKGGGYVVLTRRELCRTRKVGDHLAGQGFWPYQGTFFHIWHNTQCVDWTISKLL